MVQEYNFFDDEEIVFNGLISSLRSSKSNIKDLTATIDGKEVKINIGDTFKFSPNNQQGVEIYKITKSDKKGWNLKKIDYFSDESGSGSGSGSQRGQKRSRSRSRSRSSSPVMAKKSPVEIKLLRDPNWNDTAFYDAVDKYLHDVDKYLQLNKLNNGDEIQFIYEKESESQPSDFNDYSSTSSINYGIYKYVINYNKKPGNMQPYDLKKIEIKASKKPKYTSGGRKTYKKKGKKTYKKRSRKHNKKRKTRKL
jgi:hypothetical protein